MNGAPNGVDPRNTSEYRAMTRPRISGATRSCSVDCTPDENVTVATPSATSAATCTAMSGAIAATICSTPNAVADTTSSRGVTAARAPATRPPVTDPAAIAMVSIVYVPAPPPQVSCAMSGRTTAKLNASSPTSAIIASGTRSSADPRT